MASSPATVPAQAEADWYCFPCAIDAEVDPVDPTAADTRCVSCGTLANPCALLRLELRDLKVGFQALQAAVQQPLGAASPTASRVELPDSMTSAEAAAYLRLPSIRALYQAVHRGQVPVRRLGARRMRFDRAELDGLLARR
jgi:excisionase family DNA binding protein